MSAQAGVARDIDDRPPPSPEIEAACERIREVIRSKRPPDEDSLVNARPREMAAEVGGEMNAGIENRADSVRDGYSDMENAPAGQPSREAVPVELPPEQVDIPEIDAAAGVPDELSSEDISLDADVSAQRQRIEEAGIDHRGGRTGAGRPDRRRTHRAERPRDQGSGRSRADAGRSDRGHRTGGRRHAGAAASGRAGAGPGA